MATMMTCPSATAGFAAARPPTCKPDGCETRSGTMAECACGTDVNASCASVRVLPGLNAGFRVKLMPYWLEPSGCKSVAMISGETGTRVRFVRLFVDACKMAVMFVNGNWLDKTTATELVPPASRLVDPKLKRNS